MSGRSATDAWTALAVTALRNSITPEAAALQATIALAKWLRSVARRAEVEGLVDRAEDARQRITIHAREGAAGSMRRWADHERAVRDLDAAVRRLAELAKEGV